MKILITGGAGYIGSVLVPLSLERGHHVTVVDNFMYRQTPLLDSCYSDRFEIVRGDVRDERLMDGLLAKADVILPLACLTGAPLCDYDAVGARTINYEAVKYLYDKKSKNQALIFPCTNSGYGIGQEGIHCDEQTPMRPVSLYGRLKVELESYLLQGGNCLTFRFATLFGPSPRMRLDLLVNDFVYRAVTDRSLVLFEAHFKRNYLHVRDAARAFLHAIDNYETMKGKPYNVGLSTANLSKLELAQIIQKYVPKLAIQISEIGEDLDKRNYIVSNARIEATGFMPQYSLDDGVAQLLKVYQILRRKEYANF